MPTEEELNAGFTLGDWEVLPTRCVLRRGDEEVRPAPKVWDLLMALARRDGDLATKDELIAEVWEGRIFGDEPIQQAVKLLRKDLGDTKPFTYVETIPKVGYRLMKPIVPHVPATPEVVSPADTAEFMPDLSRVPSVRRWRITAAVMALGFAAVLWFVWPDDVEPEPQSLAILPIRNLSGDPANAYLVEGIKNTLAHRLAQLQGFTIKNAKADYDGEASKIARSLGVESVLWASLFMEGDKLRVNYEIATGRDNKIVATGEIDGNIGHVFALQERFAEAVRARLAGKKTPELIKRNAAPDSKAYDSYMRGMYALEHRGEAPNLEDAIDLFEESIGLDDSYGPAYLALATAYALMPDYRGADLAEYHARAIDKIERGIAMDSTIVDPAGAIYGFIYHQQKRWVESERAHQKAINANVVDSNAFNWYSRMLASVGRLEDSLQQALAGGRIDPDNAVLSSRIAMSYTWLGMNYEAAEYFERANRLGATGTTHVIGNALLYQRLHEFDRAQELTLAALDMAGVTSDWVDAVFTAFREPEEGNVSAAIAALNDAEQAGMLAPAVSVISRTLLGDVDGAMAVAERLVEPGEVFEMDLLYIPEMRPLREHPEFPALLERLGIVSYWEQAGCTWDGDRVAC